VTPDTPVDGGSTGTGTGPGTTPVAQEAAATGCRRIVAGPKSKKLRSLGKLRLSLARSTCLPKAVKARVKPRKGVALKSVRYKLDGKRMARVKKLKFGAKLRRMKLTPGTHRLELRVTPRTGKATTFKVRLRVAVA